MLSSPAKHRAVKVPLSLPKKKSKETTFSAALFFDSAGLGRKVEKVRVKELVFSQGDPAKTVLYLLEGGVKLTVVNVAGKEAVVAMLGPGDFVGEGCLLGLPFRVSTATAIMRTTLLAIEKGEMMRVLHREHALSEHFISYMLSRNSRIEGDLIDQLFNSSEKRLARALLLLARYGEQGRPQKEIPPVSQEMLAGMIGTTRPRVSAFMNKFRKLGFIEYGGRLRGLLIKKSLLGAVLQD
jgi:CRP/FNR family cyclic AMP-dependent transcriptional regulator